MRLAIFILAIALLAVPSAQATEGKSAPMSCMIGPVTKMIGGSPWLVYACADGKSLAVVSAPESPATPFYFIVAARGNAYAISGEGNGQRSATKPAFDALAAMSPEAVAALYKEVLEAAKPNASEDSPPNNASERTRGP